MAASCSDRGMMTAHLTAPGRLAITCWWSLLPWCAAWRLPMLARPASGEMKTSPGKVDWMKAALHLGRRPFRCHWCRLWGVEILCYGACGAHWSTLLLPSLPCFVWLGSVRWVAGLLQPPDLLRSAEQADLMAVY